MNYLRRLREQHELRAASAQRMGNHHQKQLTGKIADCSTSSILNLISQNTNGNKSMKSYGNSSKTACSNRTSVTSLDNPIIVTTLNKLEHEMNYLELCHSS